MKILSNVNRNLLVRGILFAAVLLAVPFASARETERVTAEQANTRLDKGGAVLVDVREPEEWAQTGVAAPAVLLPLSDLRGQRKLWRDFLEKNRDKELLLYCRSGNRSAQAADILSKEGFKPTNAGAFREWQEAGLPTRKP